MVICPIPGDYVTQGPLQGEGYHFRVCNLHEGRGMFRYDIVWNKVKHSIPNKMNEYSWREERSKEGRKEGRVPSCNERGLWYF